MAAVKKLSTIQNDAKPQNYNNNTMTRARDTSSLYLYSADALFTDYQIFQETSAAFHKPQIRNLSWSRKAAGSLSSPIFHSFRLTDLIDPGTFIYL